MNLRALFRYLRLDYEIESFESIHDEIERGVVFKGTNLWILIFAIFVASVGLNINSTAVIIGAMLISPLMGPINGIGYSIATYNHVLFVKAMKNFGFAVGAGLVASMLYFMLSPVSKAHSELLARTSPTIYDVMIAFFGGLAGIVAISSKLKGNVIPGVAIATALMPPLCTAGYGLASAQFNYFLGAMYLFTINTVFIALAALLVSRALKFPMSAYIDKSNKKKIQGYVFLVIVLTITPSLYFGYRMVENQKYTESCDLFVASVRRINGAYLLENKIDAPSRSISLVYGGDELTSDTKKEIEKRLQDFNIPETQLIFNQGFAWNRGFDIENIHLKEQLNVLNASLKDYEHDLDSLKLIPNQGEALLRELETLFPVESCIYAESIQFSDSSKGDPVKLVFLKAQQLDDKQQKSIQKWLQERLKSKSVRVVFEVKENM